MKSERKIKSNALRPKAKHIYAVNQTHIPTHTHTHTHTRTHTQRLQILHMQKLCTRSPLMSQSHL